MKVLIVDDEKPARDRLRRLLNGLTDYAIVGEAENGEQALRQNESLTPDIILMDIRMPGIDGLQAAHHLMHLTHPPAIIFTTAFSDHALEAFETHAIDYLLKPIKIDRLMQALESCGQINRVQMQSRLEALAEDGAREHICARVRGNLMLIPLSDIYYFRAEQKYVTVRHVGGEVLIEEPLKALAEEFREEFHRVHRNALVRLDKIAGMRNSPDSHRVFFNDIDETLEVSRRHLTGVRKILKSL